MNCTFFEDYLRLIDKEYRIPSMGTVEDVIEMKLPIRHGGHHTEIQSVQRFLGQF